MAEKSDTLNTGYQCFNCGTYGVMWQADFDYADYGLDGEGIIHTYQCANCGAYIEYYVDAKGDENETV